MAVLVIAVFPSSALAARVVVLGHNGHATVRNDPFVTGPAVTPQPTLVTTAGRRRVRHGQRNHHRRRRHQVTVAGTLRRIYLHHHISAAKYHGYVAAFRRALATERRLSGTRRSELAAVTSTIHQIAAAHKLTAPRLPVLFAILAVNQQWWTTGPLLSAYQRVEIAGSQLVWEYYPGQGIQLQVLGTFGKADGLYTGGPANYPQLQQLLSEMIPMAARRGGGLAWEYYFHFDGGAPPWTSAMSQATGLEALSRAYTATHNGYYLDVARRALPIFSRPPNAGVAEETGRGVRFMQYTFAPHTDIINAFLQTLIGLYSYAQASGNPTAQKLFDEGNAEAIAEVPHYDTGAWSLYQPGVEDDLSYHKLVTGFLSQLCTWLGTPVYCTTAQHFQSYLKTPPVLAQLTKRVRAGRPLTMHFRLSKVSHVGIVISQGSHTVFATSASFPYGVDRFYVPAIKRAGTYSVVLDGTDLAGNFSRITGTLTVTPRKRHRP